MRGATLFSGIGAPECSAPSIDWLWGAEIDAFPSAVLAHRFPHLVNLGDVSADDFCERATQIGRPDVLVFGSPCQSFSVAGKRLGMDDPRGNLALVALGIARRLRPEWLVFENVPGLLSSADGRDFGLFLRAMEECGYLGVWRVLNAEFAGVPQRRRRIFLVAYLGDWRPPAAVLLEPESLSGNPPPSREAGERTAPTISARPTGGGGLGTDFDLDGGLITSTGSVAHCLNAGAMGRIDYESETMIAHTLRGEGFDASEDGPGRGTPIVPVAYRTSGNCGAWETGDKADALTTATDPNNHVIAFSAKDSGGDAINDLSPTLRAGGHDGSHANAGVMPAIAIQERAVSENPSAGPQGKGWQENTSFTLEARHHAQAVAHHWAVRRLTPTECERLQGFPDGWTDIPYRNGRAADGPRYKALGNSMAVPVIGWILDRVQKVDSVLREARRAAACPIPPPIRPASARANSAPRTAS